MRMIKDQESDPSHRPFSDVTKGKLMGLCGVTKWCNMPAIWNEIESCKTDKDLRVILQNHWDDYKTDLNTMFHDMYWGEELLRAIRTGDFTRSNTATYLTSEMGLSMMLLMPRTDDEIIELEAEWERRKRAGKNVTTADYKAAEKAPRMPPVKWEEVCLLFTTWALLLKMLFTNRNAHFLGLNSIRRHLMSLSKDKYLYSPSYFANIVWCVLDDAIRTFNQAMPYDDLVTATELTILQFPTTRLHKVAEILSMQSDYSMATFPQQWKLYAERRANHSFLPSTVGGQEGASVSGATIGTLMSAISNLIESTRRSGTTRGGNNPTNSGGTNKQQQQQFEDVTREFREKHPERYGREAANPDVHQDIKTMLTGMGDVNFYKVLGANNKSWYQLKKEQQAQPRHLPRICNGKVQDGEVPSTAPTTYWGRKPPTSGRSGCAGRLSQVAPESKAGRTYSHATRGGGATTNETRPHTVTIQGHLRNRLCGG